MRGIYKITNQVNGKVYIGRASNVFDRIDAHFGLLRVGDHHSSALQEDYDKFGLSEFTVNILETPTLDKIVSREAHLIRKYNSYEEGYNQRDEAKFSSKCAQKKGKEDFIKMAFMKVEEVESKPSIKYFEEDIIEMMLPVLDNKIDLLRGKKHILVIPDRYREYRNIPYIFVYSDLH